MAKLSSKDEKTAAKLRKLSKDDLIWCILEMEKYNLGFPSISSILSDLEHKKTMDNIGRCEKLAKQAHEKRMAYVVFLNYNGTSSNLESGIITRVSEHTAEISGNRRAEYKIIKVNPVRPTMDNTWISCSERLPEDLVLVNVVWVNRDPPTYYEKIKDVPISGTACRYKGNWYWDSPACIDQLAETGENKFDLVDDGIDITHWMPLPEPPKKGELK